MAAQLAIVGARIRTLVPARPSASNAMRTEVLHACGQALVPGLVDAHVHPCCGAELARGVDLSGCRTLAQVRRGSGLQVDDAGLTTATGAAGTGAARRSTPVWRGC